MKSIIIVILLSSYFVSSNAQSKIPPLVSSAFNTKYPGAQQVQWSPQDGDYKVSFNAEGFKYEAKYSENGNWLVSQRSIGTGELPANIRSSISKEFADWSIRSTFKLFLPGMITQYRVVVSKNDNKEKSLLFSQDGKLLKDDFAM